MSTTTTTTKSTTVASPAAVERWLSGLERDGWVINDTEMDTKAFGRIKVTATVERRPVSRVMPSRAAVPTEDARPESVTSATVTKTAAPAVCQGPGCENTLPARSGRGRVKAFCSAKCRQAAHRRQQRAAASTAPATNLCADAVAALRSLADQLSTITEAEISALDPATLPVLLKHTTALAKLVPAAAHPIAPSAPPAPPAATPAEPGALFAAPASVTKKAPRVRAGGFTPTGQQEEIEHAYLTGDNLVIEAGAGTGKTSTLRMLAAAAPDRRGIYVAFNKAVATEAKGKFGKNFECTTAHGLAYRALGWKYKARLNGPRVPAHQLARSLHITTAVQLDTLAGMRLLDPAVLARLAANTVDRFCQSADLEPGRQHVPPVNGIDGDAHYALQDYLVPLARQIWADLQRPDGWARFSHDHYLKIWALTNPRLTADVILFDEAQDANPVMSELVQSQKCQLIAVGDANQAIYGWRGAIDALATWPTQIRLPLSQSWRFGPVIAAEANKWLTALRSTLRLTGTPTITSRIGTIKQPDAILCRTNAEALGQAMAAMEDDIQVALVGGGSAIKAMAEAALALQDGRSTSHPELCAFRTWNQVQDYVDTDESASDLGVFVKLVDNHGADEVISAADQLVDERHAQLTISTAHKAKGREWSKVRIGNDFRAPKTDPDDPQPLPKANAMLAYVAVTRAQHQLDRAGLAGIDEFTSRS